MADPPPPVARPDEFQPTRLPDALTPNIERVITRTVMSTVMLTFVG